MYLIFDGGFGNSFDFGQSVDLDFIIKMTDVAYDGVVFHGLDVIGGDDISVSGGSYEYIYFVKDVFNGDYFESFHTGLEGTNGVYFGDKYSGSTLFHTHGWTFSNVSITTDQYFFASDHDIGGSVEGVG